MSEDCGDSLSVSRWPAEWEPHAACIILYPHNPSTFRANCDPARNQVRQLAQTVASRGNEDVVLLCNTEEDAATLKEELLKFETDDDVRWRMDVMVCPSDDSWARDTCPTFVREGSAVVGIDWDFNAYGGPVEGCYWPCELDRVIASTSCRLLSNHYKVPLKSRRVPLVLEGGSIHTDGQGTVLTTAECLLHANRNPHITQSQIEGVVLEALHCTKMIWLPSGLAADEDTNGHVDNLACFVGPGNLVLSWTDDNENDPDNYERCRAAWKVLESETDATGQSLTIHKIFLPPPMYYTEEEIETMAPVHGVVERAVGQRLAASYVNFYIANDAVVVPQFGLDPWDKKAIETLAPLFPNRQVVGLPSREILLGGGNIHCFTQQLPRLLLEKS